MRFRVLGPLEVWDDRVQLEIAGQRQRALLGFLVLHRNEVISVEQIIAALWGDHPPTDPHHIVRGYIAELVGVVGADALVTHPWGYGLRAAEGAADVDEFERLVDRAGREKPARAAETLREALGLWRGPALADVASDLFAEEEITRLEESRSAALRELRAGSRVRMFGGVQLFWRRLAIVARRRRRVIAAIVAAAAAATAVAVFGLRRGESAEVATGPGMVAGLDPRTNRFVDAFTVGGVPTRLVVAGNAVWVVNALEGTLVRIDLPSRSVRTLSIGSTSTGIAAPSIAVGANSLWVANGRAGTARVDLGSGEVLHAIKLSDGRNEAAAVSVAAGLDDVWVDGIAGLLTRFRRPLPPTHWMLWRIDPRTNAVARRVPVAVVGPGLPNFLAATIAGDSLWLRSERGIARFDRRRGHGKGRVVLARKAIVPQTGEMAAGAGSLWVPDNHNNVVWRVDLKSGTVVDSIPVRWQPAGVAFGAGAVWIANGTGTILRVDPTTTKVVASIPVNGVPSAIAFGSGRVWVALD